MAVGFLAAFLVIAALAWTGLRTARAYHADARMVAHTRQVIGVIAELDAAITQAGGAQRTFLLTGESVYQASQQDALARARALDDSLRALVADNPRQLEVLDRLEIETGDWRGVLEKNSELLVSETMRSEVMRERMALLWQGLTRVHATLGELTAHENELLELRQRDEELRSREVLWVFFGLLVAVGVFMLGLFPHIRREIAERRAAEALARQTNEQLRLSTQELDHTNHELEAFTYSVSHDLRAPVRAIDGFSRIIQDDHSASLDTEGLRLLGVVRNSSQRMGKLIDDLLAFSRLGRQALSRAPVEMRAIVQRLLESLQFAPGSSRPQVTVGPLAPASGDGNMLTQVWANLIDNAVKYSSQRETPQIHIDSYEAAGELVYRVRDNGAGFDMRYYDKLFGVFQRLHGATEYPGTGVGLAIVKRVVERHGGRAWAEGAPGAGATFYFSLPREAS